MPGKRSIFSKWPNSLWHTVFKINNDLVLPLHTECHLAKFGNNTMVLKITCRNQFIIKISIFSNINLPLSLTNTLGPSWSWSYGSWIYNYLFAISAYRHYHCELESRSWRGVLDTTLCDVSELRQVGGFLWVLWFLPPIKLTATI